MKRRGSILIEVIASLSMLSLIMIFGINTYIHNNKVLKERKLNEQVSRAIYNLMNEIKYNMTIDQINELLSDETIELKFTDDFSKQLMYKDINCIDKGDEIKISLLEKNEYELVILITALIEKENYKINVDKTFTKSWWMEYV